MVQPHYILIKFSRKFCLPFALCDQKKYVKYKLQRIRKHRKATCALAFVTCKSILYFSCFEQSFFLEFLYLALMYCSKIIDLLQTISSIGSKRFHLIVKTSNNPNNITPTNKMDSFKVRMTRAF